MTFSFSSDDPPSVEGDSSLSDSPASDACDDKTIISVLTQLSDAVAEQQESLAASMRTLVCRMDDGFAAMAKLLSANQQPGHAVADVSPASDDNWLRAVLGPTLAGDRSLDCERRRLARDVLANDPGACALAGQLLVFQASSPQRMPALLKDIGEAYYRWQPKRDGNDNPMETAIAAWLARACGDAGVAVSIALVHPGERFDVSRHVASGRGVEITEVAGWTVLRDNGKVYTKAAVAVR